MPEKKVKKVCKCENCGNEAEMMFTCSLEPEEEQPPTQPKPAQQEGKQKVKGHGVCNHCGNEADMWIDL
jgi:hypothetical protein